MVGWVSPDGVGVYERLRRRGAGGGVLVERDGITVLFWLRSISQVGPDMRLNKRLVWAKPQASSIRMQ